MRRGLGVALAATLLLAGTSARADDAECNPAYEQADLLRKQPDKLIEAREKLRVCSRSSCKAWMVKDCTKWLEESESKVASIILVATRENGSEMLDASVTMDGKPFAAHLDGKALEIAPGEHTFVFTFTDGKRAARTATIKEGQKGQTISVTLGNAKPEPEPAKPTPAPAPASSPRINRSDAPERSNELDLRIVGLGVAGLGLAGVVVGTIFGFSAMSSKDDAACVGNKCDAEPLADARSAATFSTIGFVAGGVLIAGGAALFLFAPQPNARVARNPRGLFTVTW